MAQALSQMPVVSEVSQTKPPQSLTTSGTYFDESEVARAPLVNKVADVELAGMELVDTEVSAGH